MKVVCPNCSTRFPLAAGVAEDDGKRLAVLFADMEPVLGRAAIGYLRLFKPAKTELRNARAITVITELLDLVRPGTVCRDERNGLRRPAPPALWAAGIEQMLALPGKLQLPLSGHNYLRAIVWSLADQADAVAERQREATLRSGSRPAAPAVRETPLQSRIAWLRQQLEYGQINQAEFDAQVIAAHTSLGGDP
jgi:hypothetical protein